MVASPAQLKRYGEIARVLVRNRASVRLAGDEDAGAVDDDETRRQGERLAADLEEMGPTFVKLGQLLSTRSDLLPAAYLEALSRLQDEVAPFGADEARRIVEEELGLPVADAFASFSDEPMASASLGQVHRAKLADGRAVVVKVQRPGVPAQVAEDVDALGEIAKLLDGHTDAGRRFGFEDLLEQFRHSITEELDYRHEAANLVHLGQVVGEDARLVVPQPVPDLSSRRVLTMDEIEGEKVTDLARGALEGGERAELADALLHTYLEQIFVHGFFHADPHPGNVMVSADHRLALVDLGMVGYIRSGLRTALVQLLLAVEEGRGQEAGEVLVRLGRPLEDFDEDRLVREVAELVARRQGLRMADLRVGELITELSRTCGASGLRPPPELALLARALLDLDSVTRTLDPDFEPALAIRRHATAIVGSHMQASSGGLLSALVEARDFAEQLPGRVNRVADALSRGRFEVRVHAFDEAEMLHSLTKIANRMAVGVVTAGLLLAGALLTRAYPAFGLACVAAAFALGITMLVQVAASDRHLKLRVRRGRRT